MGCLFIVFVSLHFFNLFLLCEPIQFSMKDNFAYRVDPFFVVLCFVNWLLKCLPVAELNVLQKLKFSDRS